MSMRKPASILPFLKGHLPLVAGLALALILLIVLLPYRPPTPRLVGDAAGRSFSAQFADFLKIAFEHGEPQSIQDEFGFSRIDYLVLPRSAQVEIFAPTGVQHQVLISKAMEGGIDLGYARVLLPETLPVEVRERIAAALSDPRRVLGEYEHSRASRPVRPPNLAADRYAHSIMLVMAFTLLALALWGFRGRFTARDWPLLAVLGAGLVSVFIVAQPGITDIKLHFFNEARQIWRWDVYGPANPAWQKLLYRFFGVSDQVLFRANSLMGILCAIPFYLLLRDRFGGHGVAWVGALLLVTHPTWLFYTAGDIAHPWAFFFFFGAAAILSRPELPSTAGVMLAASALSLSMLGRAELMTLGPVLLLVLGATRLRELLTRRARGVIYGSLLVLVLLLPQVMNLLSLIFLRTDEFVTWRWEAALMTWIWLPYLGGYNTYTNLLWSPWPHIVLVPIGAALLLWQRLPTALGLLIIAPLFLWNDFYLQPEFSTTHYQLPALPFYIIFAAIAGAEGLRRIRKHLDTRTTAGLALALAVGLWLTSVWAYRDLLSTPFTFQKQYQQVSAHRHLVDPACVLMYYKPYGDHDLHNPKLIWFDYPEGFREYRNLAHLPPPPASDGLCLYYLRTPSCQVLNRDAPGSRDRYFRECEEIESKLTMEPLYESLLPARAAFDERYFSNPIETGLFRVTHWDGHPVDEAPAQENPPAPGVPPAITQ